MILVYFLKQKIKQFNSKFELNLKIHSKKFVQIGMIRMILFPILQMYFNDVILKISNKLTIFL